MDELKTDCKNCEQWSVLPGDGLSDVSAAQEVTTMLRDRLTTLSSDLIEARSRISELEAILAQDRQAIGSLSAKLGASSTCAINWVRFLELELNVGLDETTRDLSREVKTMAKELRDAISNAVELETELAGARERYVQNAWRR